MSTTRKISFTLIFVLLLSPIVVAENLVGAVVKKSPESFLVEQAGKQATKLLLGKAADSIFGNEMDEIVSQLTSEIDDMEKKITGEIQAQTTQLTREIDKTMYVAHKVDVSDKAGDLSGEIGEYINNTNYDNPEAVSLHISKLDTILSSSNKYSTKLAADIQIGLPTDNKWNGFWRSFAPYVSNKATYAAFKIQQWQAQVRGKILADNEKQALTVANRNLDNLEGIYKHLERNVPTMPISDGSPLERHVPYQQNLNCVIRTDPETQLVTSKGELIRRYAGYDDVADHLPSAANVSRMWGYCRGDKSNRPPAYGGWKNTNYEWAAGKHVGPTDDVNECRLISTFGRCKEKGVAYGCTMEPVSDVANNDGYQGLNPIRYHNDTDHHNDIRGHKHSVGRTWYTKFLWSEAPKVLDGSPAHWHGGWHKSSLTGQGTFVNYLRTWENTVCAMGPDGKKISQEFPNAPALPHLPTEYLTSTPDSYPKKITDSLPLTLIKTKTPNAYMLSDRDADTSAAYYFIKRNHITKTAELSKAYQSELSAAHDRSLHYFTEFKDEGLQSAYCNVAAIASLTDNLLNTLAKKTGVGRGTLQSRKAMQRARQISYKLGITKENAAGCFSDPKSNHIVASRNDATFQALEVRDHMIRSCLNFAAITNWWSHPHTAAMVAKEHKHSIRAVRAACNAHGKGEINFTKKLKGVHFRY